MQKLASGFAVLVLAGGLPQAPRQTDPGLIVRAVRFFRPDQERTRVKALVQIPYTILRPAEADGVGHLLERRKNCTERDAGCG